MSLRCVIGGVAAAFLLTGPIWADNKSTQPPSYDVNRTELPPVIDGVVTEGEWDSAAAAAGSWVDLVTHAPDTHNLRFRMLWDDLNLYILGESDWTGFGEPQDYLTDPDFNGATYNPNFYFDPNVDQEDWSSPDFDPTIVDGYRFAWSMEEGFFLRTPTVEQPTQSLRDPLDATGGLINDYISGLFLEAHVNNAFGNQGEYDLSDDGPNSNYRDDLHPGIVYALSADNEDLNGTGVGGGVWEFAIAWTEFNATDPTSGNPAFNELLTPGDATDFLENGLYHPFAPSDGDVWAFETAVITNDPANFLPSWSEPMGGNEERMSFATWQAPHGRIQFVGIPGDPLDCNGDDLLDVADLTCATTDSLGGMLVQLNLLPGDFDGDGTVGFSDFLVLSANFGTAVAGYTQGDINLDGDVNFPDFLVLSSNFGSSSQPVAAAVPEPNSALLLLVGIVGVVRRRRA